MDLTKQQMAVRDSNAKKIAVIAGAGAGKTLALAARVERLCAQGERVTVLALTNAACRELRERLGALDGLRVATFHSLAYGIVAENAIQLGFSAPPTVLSEEESQDILKAAKAHTGCKASLDAIRKAHEARGPIESTWPTVLEYRARLKGDGSIDFEALITEARRALAWCSVDLRAELGHLLIDEAQDADRRIWKFLEELGAENVCAVGDPRQAVFGFRGGDAKAFMRFHAEADERLELSENFRSRPEIVSYANELPVNCGMPLMVPERGASGIHGLDSIPRTLLPQWLTKHFDSSTVILARNNRTLDSLEAELRSALLDLAIVRRRPNVTTDGARVVRWYCRGLENPWNRSAALAVLTRMLSDERRAVDEIHRAILDELPPCSGWAREMPPWSLTEDEANEWLVAQEWIQRGELDLYLLACARGELDGQAPEMPRPGSEFVELSTIHGAKAREWDVVYALREGLRSGEDDERLWYVAATRAREVFVEVTNE